MRGFSKQALSFAFIGAIGFVVDGGILTLLNSAFGLSLIRARLASFPIAITLTWYLNRKRTFAHIKNPDAAGEWGRYAFVNSIGALLNLAIFLWLIQAYDALAAWPILALALAASVALVFNFLVSRHVAFRPRQS
jgi:putative flippase GtrA